jgi:hypothetical protein
MNASNSKTEIFAALQTLSGAIPSMRAGQLVAAIGELCADMHGRGLWDAEDNELLEAIWQFQRNLESSGIDSPKVPATETLQNSGAA